MSPETISLILFGIQEAIKAEPAIASMLQNLFSGGIPTAADWEALRASIQTPFATLAPDADAAATAAAAGAPDPLTIPALEQPAAAPHPMAPAAVQPAPAPALVVLAAPAVTAAAPLAHPPDISGSPVL